jgi:hypothetical protein
MEDSVKRPNSKRVAHQYLTAMEALHLLAVADDSVTGARRGHRVRTAGEVRFIKDRGGDTTEWAWNTAPPSNREIDEDYKFDARNLEPLTRTLRSLLSALGFAMSGYTSFTKTKSALISPDGSLGGRGYIMKIPDIRRQLMNCIEVLSSVSDTIYDEVNATHWHPDIDGASGNRERSEVEEIMSDVEEIRQNPEEWAKDEEAEMDAEHAGESEPPQNGKTARQLAAGWLYQRASYRPRGG